MVIAGSSIEDYFNESIDSVLLTEVDEIEWSLSPQSVSSREVLEYSDYCDNDDQAQSTSNESSSSKDESPKSLSLINTKSNTDFSSSDDSFEQYLNGDDGDEFRNS